MSTLTTAEDLGPAFDDEDTETTSLEDARHWVAVYAELMEGVTRAGVDGKLVQLSARLVFWQRRLKGLSDPSH